MLIQVLDERNSCVFEQRIVDVPEDMYYAPDTITVTLDSVKTAISYHQFLKKEVDEAARR